MFDTVEAFYRPDTVREALRLLQNGKNRARVVAGGTDLVVEADQSIRFLIDITHAGLSYIRRKGKACVIGATTTMAAIENSPVIRALAGGGTLVLTRRWHGLPPAFFAQGPRSRGA